MDNGSRGDFMMNDIKKHLTHYLLLFLILLTGGWAFFFYHDNLVKFKIAVLTSAAYFFWGIIHHLSERNLTFKVMVEYMLMALLSLVLLGGVLL